MTNISAIIETAKLFNINLLYIQTFKDAQKAPEGNVIQQGWGYSTQLFIPHLTENNAEFKKLKDLNEKGHGISFRRNGANTAKDTKFWNHLVIEIDPSKEDLETKGVDVCLAEQIEAVNKVCFSYSFPQPSLAISTGGKSYHFYWKTDKLDVLLGKKLQNDLIAAFNSIGVEPDKACGSEAQAFRLPGFVHAKTGNYSSILDNYGTGLTYSYDELRSQLPESVEEIKLSRIFGASSGVSVGNLKSLDDLVDLYDEHLDQLSPRPNSKRNETTITKIAKKFAESATPGNRNNASLELGLQLGSSVLKDLGVIKTFDIGIALMDDQGVDIRGNNRQTLVNGLIDGFINFLEAHNEEVEQEKVGADSVTSDKYVAVDFNDRKVCMLKSPIGTGKTTSIKRQVEDTLAINPDAKVLVVSHRVALCFTWGSSLDGFVTYNDKGLGNLSSVNKLICSVDSIHRLISDDSITLPKYDLIVLDEVDQALNHLTTSTTLKHDRRRCIETIWSLIYNANKVITASATTSNREINFLSKIVERNNIWVVDNQIQPLTKIYIRHENEESIRQSIMEAIKLNRNIAISCNSKKTADATYQRITQAFPEIIVKLITSANSQSEKEFIKNINEEIISNKIQVLIYSPTLGTGVDINLKDYFEEVFLIGDKTSCLSALDLLQLAGRVRYPISSKVHAYVQEGIQSLETNYNKVREMMLSSSVEVPTYIDYKLNKVVKLNEVLHETVIEYITSVKVFNNKHTIDLSESFWEGITSQGHKIEYQALPETIAEYIEDGVLDSEKQIIKRIKLGQQEDHLIAIEQAPVLTEYQVDELRKEGKTRNFTIEESASIEKYYFTRNTGITEPTVDEIKWYVKGGKSALNLHRIAAMSETMVAAEDKYEREVDGKLQQDQTNYADKRYLVNTLLKLIPDNFDNDTLVESGFTSVLEANISKVRSILGVKVSLKTPVKTARDVLKKLGIKTDVKKTRVVGKNVRLYSINQESKAFVENIKEEKREVNNKFNSELCYSRFSKLGEVAKDIPLAETLNNIYHTELTNNKENLNEYVLYSLFPTEYALPF